MLREVIGATFTAGIGAIILWLIFPMLNTTKNAVWSGVDETNPVNAQLLALGDTVFMGLIFMVVLVVGFVVIMYAIRRDPFPSGAFAN
jgi:hypothetical protein